MSLDLSSITQAVEHVIDKYNHLWGNRGCVTMSGELLEEGFDIHKHMTVEFIDFDPAYDWYTAYGYSTLFPVRVPEGTPCVHYAMQMDSAGRVSVL